MSDQSNQSFRVAVLGAGAMGLFGGSLFEGGADVTLIDLDVSLMSNRSARTASTSRRMQANAAFTSRFYFPPR
jgi:ketopantoate reductase